MTAERECNRNRTIERRDLLVQYRIAPNDYCPVAANEDFDIKEVRTHATAEGTTCEMILLAPQVEDGRALITHSSGTTQCPCGVFAEYDAIPVVKTAEGRGGATCSWRPTSTTTRSSRRSRQTSSR